jgi:hypothetical protein
MEDKIYYLKFRGTSQIFKTHAASLRLAKSKFLSYHGLCEGMNYIKSAKNISFNASSHAITLL